MARQSPLAEFERVLAAGWLPLSADAHAAEAVALGIHQVHRRFEAGHQALVAVGGGVLVRARKEGGMLSAARRCTSGLSGEVGVGPLRRRKQRLAPPPPPPHSEALGTLQALRVADTGWHEWCGAGHIFWPPLRTRICRFWTLSAAVIRLGRRKTQFLLAARAHLMVVLFDRQAPAGAHGHSSSLRMSWKVSGATAEKPSLLRDFCWPGCAFLESA